MNKEHIQIGDLFLSVEEAAETLAAIRGGRVDAIVVDGSEGDQIFTFRDPSHPYRLLVEAMGEGAALTTTDGTLCYHNPRFAELVGLGESLRGERLSSLVAPAARAAIDKLFAQVGFGPARAEVELVHPNGEGVPVQLSLSPAMLADVPVVCVVATDLTEHKRQENLYRRARLEVEARDRLFSIAAHELRNPLQALDLRLSGLAVSINNGQGAPISADKAGAAVEFLTRQSKRLTELLNKLLDVGTMGQLKLSPEPLDLGELVSGVVERHREILRASSSEVTLDLQPVRGYWDRVRVEQVVENLVSNAVKYGLGRPIRIAVAEAGSLARIEVRDQGIGIPPADAQRLFQPYERMANVSTVKGIGLGLFIASEIVRAHGGAIHVEGEPGAGSRFVVELPRNPVAS